MIISVKIWVLVLNYKCPNKRVLVLLFYGFICDFLEFPLVKSFKIFTAHHVLWDMNYHPKEVGLVQVFFISIFASFCFYCCEKGIDFLQKQAPT